MSTVRAGRLMFLLLLLGMFPAAASAQTALSGAIAGVVRDTSGGVMPGVTVEASSPALIEKVRTAVSDDQGLYRIVDLRPGTYTVTFTLPGFGTFIREGIELTTGFTANVNAEMRVGSLEETITVSGAAPLVDTQNVMAQNVFSREMLDRLPNTKTIRGYVPLIPGATMPPANQDVGGNTGESVSFIGIHGNRGSDMVYTVNGMRPGNMMGAGGGFRTFSINAAATQEVTFQTGGISAESETGGIQMNVVPKEGGNQYSGYFSWSLANGDMQSFNDTPELVARGLRPQLKLRKIYDVNPAFGGPIKRDKLWFFLSQRSWGTEVPRPTPGDYFNATQGTAFYTPDLSRPFYARSPRKSNMGRITWQINEKNKLTLGNDFQLNCNCPLPSNTNAAPEAQGYHSYHENFADIAWTSPITNRLLFEAGGGFYNAGYDYEPIEGVRFQASDIQVTELTTGWRHNSRATQTNTDGGYGYIYHQNWNQKVSVSYVTGSHAFKTGLFIQEGAREHWSIMVGDRNYSVRNGVPTQVTIFALPAVNDNRFTNVGIFTQDQWTIRRMTLNLGLRFDYINGWDPEDTVEAGTFVPARTYPLTKNLPNFKDLSPRLGAAYDLFGNGRTAVKASLGRYVALEGPRLAQTYHPANQQVNSASRTWNDANGNFVPDCELNRPAAHGECGPLSPSTFGQPRIINKPADDILTGFGNRTYNWQASASVQHELQSGLGINLGYFRTWHGNFVVTDNQAVGPQDYSPFCISVPADSRLPNSGEQLCGFYDILPSRFGQTDNLVTQASHFGKQTDVYNGFDATLSYRFGQGGLVAGGLSTGQTVTDNCDVLTNLPESRTLPAGQETFCQNTLPFAGQTQLKLSGSYPLPWSMQVSATYQDLPGLPIIATYVATNAQIRPSLGRNLGQCGTAATCNGTVTIANLFEPNTLYEDRIRQLDLRFSKSVRVGRLSLEGMLDIYNALNASPILAMSTRYGPSWLTPQQVLAGRLLKIGSRVTF